MNPQIHTEEDYLALLDKSEESLKIILVGLDIIKHSEGEKGQVMLDESLADLAERLWEKAATHCKELLSNAMLNVFIKANGISLGASSDTQRYILLAEHWFLYSATSIHRIVASFIALRRAGVTNI